VSGSDIVLIAVPVAATEATFKAIRHLVEPNVAAAMQELRAVCAFFKLLGTYPIDVH